MIDLPVSPREWTRRELKEAMEDRAVWGQITDVEALELAEQIRSDYAALLQAERAKVAAFVEFVHNCIWTRLPAEAKVVEG